MVCVCVCVSPSTLVFGLAYAKGHKKMKKAAEDKESAALSSKGGKKTGVAPVPTSPLKRRKKKKGEGQERGSSHQSTQTKQGQRKRNAPKAL